VATATTRTVTEFPSEVEKRDHVIRQKQLTFSLPQIFDQITGKTTKPARFYRRGPRFMFPIFHVVSLRLIETWTDIKINRTVHDTSPL
jgi:hypothetical protein